MGNFGGRACTEWLSLLLLLGHYSKSITWIEFFEGKTWLCSQNCDILQFIRPFSINSSHLISIWNIRSNCLKIWLTPVIYLANLSLVSKIIKQPKLWLPPHPPFISTSNPIAPIHLHKRINNAIMLIEINLIWCTAQIECIYKKCN